MSQPQDVTLKRSQIPGNRDLRMAAICRTRALEFKAQGKKKLAANAETWAKNYERQHAERESSGRLIHFQPVPKGTCARKDEKADERVITVVPDYRPTITFVEHGTITDSGVASYLENVDCLDCRRWARNNPKKRGPQ